MPTNACECNGAQVKTIKNMLTPGSIVTIGIQTDAGAGTGRAPRVCTNTQNKRTRNSGLDSLPLGATNSNIPPGKGEQI